MQTICNTKLAVSSEKEEQCVELGKASTLTLGNGWNGFEWKTQGWIIGGDI